MTIRLDPAREATAEALPEIVPLLSRVLPRALPWLPDLEWLYLGNPSGRAWYVNARSPSGALVAHYACVPCPPLDDPRFEASRVFFPLNVAVHPGAGVPGLMVLTARSLFERLQSLGPALLLGVGNENSTVGLVRLLGFESLGRLELRLYPPGGLPREQPPRALRLDEAVVRWRASRPGSDMFAEASRGALLRRIRHHGLPIDAVLTVGSPGDSVGRLGLPGRPHSLLPGVARLYATYGVARPGGVRVPERLRPSPLEYVFRPLARDIDHDALRGFLSTRRFEFFDFDVV
jgi:hypothetical protein